MCKTLGLFTKMFPKSFALTAVLAYVSTKVSAQRPTSEVPWGGGACSTEWDCSLGGVCENSKCTCDAWWTGPNCDLLNLQRPESGEYGLCHSGMDSYYSWGGRALPETSTSPDEVTGEETNSTTWHLYASFMCDHNSLGKWTTVSSSAHFVSDSPIGPFHWSDEQCTGDICDPIVIPWSHNTVATVIDDRYQIWHIGDGIVDPSEFSPCFNKSDVHPVPPPAMTLSSTVRTAPDPGAEVFISSSKAGPNGPWTREFNNGPLTINYDKSGAWPQSATNPSPLELPDGSVRLYFTSPDDEHWCGLENNCIGVAESKNGWAGPFEPYPHHLTNLESEDSHVFIDPRGHFHMLTNINTGHARCAQGVECGGHSWGYDGLKWSNLTVGAFGPYITYVNIIYSDIMFSIL